MALYTKPSERMSSSYSEGLIKTISPLFSHSYRIISWYNSHMSDLTKRIVTIDSNSWFTGQC